MRIIFVRHAEKEEIGEDPHITKKGVTQAKKLAKRIKKEGIKFDYFYCSDLNRTKETAYVVSKEIRIKPRIEKSLNEFKSDFIKSNKGRWRKEDKKHYTQLISFLKKITSNPNSNKRILIVAHGITNRIILSFFTGISMKHSIRFVQKETAVNSVYWVEKYKNWRLTSWNDHHHIHKRFE
mgnify:CR=1 FL=1